VIAELDRLGIPIPEARETFLQRLDDYARELEAREGAFDRPEQFLALHQRGGFAIISCVETDQLRRRSGPKMAELCSRRELTSELRVFGEGMTCRCGNDLYRCALSAHSMKIRSSPGSAGVHAWSAI
jgi:hypothetical protein